MTLHGHHLIANTPTAASAQSFRAVNPSTSQPLDPAFHEATEAEADRALQLADASFDELRSRPPEERARLLEAIAGEIEALGDALLQRCHAETALPMPRLQAERARTMFTAKLFAQMIREGSWVDAVIDRALPDRQPQPRPHIRRMLAPIGPIVVFGASNFPLAISVAGTDTVSALAAGCPVVVKAHPAHPGTCEMMATAVAAAVKKCGLPAGVFSLLHGAGHAIGQALVKHPLTKAVAFTGSLRGGRALFDLAAARPQPIPVYAELGSSNPVFVLPGALKERGEQIAAGFIQSTTLGAGQFCTNPGLLLGLRGEAMSNFQQAVSRAAAEAPPATMLHAGIRDAYQRGLAQIANTKGVNILGESKAKPDPAKTQAACVIFRTDVTTYTANPHLTEEVFGPNSIVIEADATEELERIAESLDGRLTATIHGTDADLLQHARLVRILERKVGRLVFNGFPTGVEVCHAMHHGGPYPAATDPHFTSIGSASIHRFVRPLCYQNFPDAALPPELRNRNERAIWRKIDGEITKADV